MKRPDSWNGRRPELRKIYERMRAVFPERSHALAEFVTAGHSVLGIRREGETLAQFDVRLRNLFKNLERPDRKSGVTTDDEATLARVRILQLLDRLAREPDVFAWALGPETNLQSEMVYIQSSAELMSEAEQLVNRVRRFLPRELRPEVRFADYFANKQNLGAVPQRNRLREWLAEVEAVLATRREQGRV